MKYKLYEGAKNDISGNIIEQFFNNRGIQDCKTYLNLTESVVEPYDMLDNMEKAVELFMKHFNSSNKIGILIDEDVDGFCSASMLYLYIKRLDARYPVECIMHRRAKAHGLSDDVEIPPDVKLLIIPDAGTNDIKQCKALQKSGVDILILDHHECEEENPYAVIVNNQMSEHYHNKDLCGAGVVYRFLQAVDNETWNEFADDFLDLCAFANISDVMDMRSAETKYFVNKGLQNINNKFMQALIQAQDYSMNGKVNVHNVQWYLTPVVNSMVRVGSQEDKDLVFRAFIEKDETFEYKKRATKNKPAEVIQENIYDRAARLCKNTKSRQDRMKDKAVTEIVELAKENPVDDKVLLLDVTDVLDSGLTGVVAIKIAEIFNKPCMLVKKYFDNEQQKYVYAGSARNIDHSPIDSFKDVINDSKVFNFAKGHASAFGVNVDCNKMDEAINCLNTMLKDIEYDSTYRVDFILDVKDMDLNLILRLSQLEDSLGQGIEEPMVTVKNICLNRSQLEIFGKNEDTISFVLNEIKYVQFKCKEGNPLYDWIQNAWDENEEITFEIVGKPTINDYNGLRTPQVIIEDVNVINTEESNMIFDEDFEYEVWEEETDW